MRCSKRRIAAALVSGLSVEPRDVVRTSRNLRAVTYRHVWPDSTDARIWAGLKRAAIQMAQLCADRTGLPVEVFSAHGCLLYIVESES